MSIIPTDPNGPYTKGIVDDDTLIQPVEPQPDLLGSMSLPVADIQQDRMSEQNQEPFVLSVDNLPAADAEDEADPNSKMALYEAAPDSVKRQFDYSPEAVQKYYRSQPQVQQAEMRKYIYGRMELADGVSLETPQQQHSVTEMAAKTNMTPEMVRWYLNNDQQRFDMILANAETLNAAGPDSYIVQQLMDPTSAGSLKRDKRHLAQIEANIEAGALGMFGTTAERIGYDVRVGFGSIGALGAGAISGAVQSALDIREFLNNNEWASNALRGTPLDLLNTLRAVNDEQAEYIQAEAPGIAEYARENWLGPAIDTGSPTIDFLRTSIFQGTPFLAGSVVLAMVAGPSAAAGVIGGAMGLETYNETRQAGVSPLLAAAAAGGTAVSSYLLNSFQLSRYTRNIMGRSPFARFSVGAAVEAGEEFLSEAGESLSQSFLENTTKLIGAPGYTREQWFQDMAEDTLGAFQEGIAAGLLSAIVHVGGTPRAVRNQARAYAADRALKANIRQVAETELYKNKQFGIIADTANNMARHNGRQGYLFATIGELEQGGMTMSQLALPVDEGGLGISREDLNLAQSMNVDVVVPYGNAMVFAARQQEAGNAYYQDVFRIDPDAMSGREIFEQQREVAQVLEIAGQHFKEFEATGNAPERIKLFRDGLSAFGFDRNQSEALASVFWARADRAAELWGITPEEWLEQQNVQLELDRTLGSAREISAYERRLQGVNGVDDQVISEQEQEGQNNSSEVAAAQNNVLELTQPAMDEGDNQAWENEALNTILDQLGLQGEMRQEAEQMIRQMDESVLNDPDMQGLAQALGIELPTHAIASARPITEAITQSDRARTPERIREIQEKFIALGTIDVSSEEVQNLQKERGVNKAIIEWVDGKNILKDDYVNNDTGWGDIQFRRSSIRDVINHGSGDGKIALLQAVPELIRDGIYLETTRRNDQGQLSHVFAAKATVDGEPYVVAFTINEDMNGRRYYNHEMTEMEKVPGRASIRNATSRPTATNREPITNILREYINVNPDTPIIEELYQDTVPELRQARGLIRFQQEAGAPTIIRLFRNADVSTVLHELNHLFMNDFRSYIRSGNATEQARSDWAALVAFTDGGLESPDQDIYRASMEKVASAWERYAMDGRAPSPELMDPFDIFRTYIGRIYRNATQQLRVEPSAEVRSVFDRFLATDQEIEESNRVTADEDVYFAQIQDVDASELARLRDLRHKADAARRRKYDARYGGGNVLRNMTSVEDLRRRVRREMYERPVYRAIGEAQQNGGMNRQSVVDAIGEPGAKELAACHGDAVFGGEVNLVSLARANQYADPVAMLAEMAETPSFESEVDARAREQNAAENQRTATMEENEGSIIEDDGGDEQGEAIAAETELAIKMRTRQNNENATRALRDYRLKRQAMRSAAEAYVGNLGLRDGVDVRRFQKAERDARKAALQAASKNNWAEVEAQKNLEMMHHLTVKAAMDARDLRDHVNDEYTGSRLYRKLQATQYRAKVENAYAEVLKDLATWAGFTTSNRLAPSTQSDILLLPAPEGGSNMAAFVPDLAGTLPTWLLTKQKPEGWQSWRDFTVDQLREINRAMQMLLNQGRGALNAMNDLGVQNIDELVSKSLAPMSRREPNSAISNDDRTWLGRVMNRLNNYMISLTVPEYWFMMMDGNPTIHGEDSGINQRMFWKIRDCQLQKDKMYKAIMESSAPYFSQFENARADFEARYGGRSVTIPGLPVPEILRTRKNYPTWDFNMLLSMAFHMGNDANLHAITQGYGLTQYHLDLIASQFSENTWNAVQGVWDTIDSLAPELDRVTFNITNRHMKKELAQALTVTTSDGKTIDLKGGYFPLIYDPKLSSRAEQISNEEDALYAGLMFNIHQSTRPANGMVQERFRDDNGNPLVGRPPLLDMNIVVKHLESSLHYITHAETLMEFDRVTRRPEWKAEVESKLGIERYKAIRNWMQDLARPNRTNNSPGEQIMEKLRNLATVDALGLRPTTAAKQQLGLFNAASFMGDASRTGISGWKYIKKGWREIGWGAVRGAKTEKMLWVDSVSDFMSARDGNHNREIKAMVDKITPLNDALFTNPVTGEKVTKSQISEGMFSLIQASDRLGAYTVWIGAYEQAMAGDANFDITQMSDSERHQKSVEYADSAAATQASSFAADLTAAQRNTGIMRFVSMFMSGNIRQGSRLMQYVDAYHMGDKSAADIASFAFKEFVAPALAWTLVAGAMKAGISAALGRDEDEDYLQDLFVDAAWEAVETGIAPFPIVREIPSWLRYGSDGSIPALSAPAKSVTKGVRGIRRIGEGEFAKAAWDLGDATGFWLGIPAMNLLREGKKVTDTLGITEETKR